MPANWPPASAPSWPPPEIGGDWLSYSDLRALLRDLRKRGFTQVTPTAQENRAYFRDARCDHGDAVVGRMLVSPDGQRRYPFAICSDPGHRDLLVLWPPYYAGYDSGRE